jgi:hypothetical protein
MYIEPLWVMTHHSFQGNSGQKIKCMIKILDGECFLMASVTLNSDYPTAFRPSISWFLPANHWVSADMATKLGSLSNSAAIKCSIIPNDSL